MVYRAEGETVRAGGDLYAMRATSANLGMTYPPFAALLFVPLTLVGVPLMRTLTTAGTAPGRRPGAAVAPAGPPLAVPYGPVAHDPVGRRRGGLVRARVDDPAVRPDQPAHSGRGALGPHPARGQPVGRPGHRSGDRGETHTGALRGPAARGGTAAVAPGPGHEPVAAHGADRDRGVPRDDAGRGGRPARGLEAVLDGDPVRDRPGRFRGGDRQPVDPRGPGPADARGRSGHVVGGDRGRPRRRGDDPRGTGGGARRQGGGRGRLRVHGADDQPDLLAATTGSGACLC
ncbi:hypothetical protein STANM309S_04048 [Streptomyces tanashiensis]